MSKKIIQSVLAILVMLIGAYMFLNYSLPTPPAVSGIAFFLVGLSLWIPHCPICAKICKK